MTDDEPTAAAAAAAAAADDDDDDDDVDDELLLSMTTPSSAEHQRVVKFDANRKHLVLFPTTWHVDDDVTSGDDVILADDAGATGV